MSSAIKKDQADARKNAQIQAASRAEQENREGSLRLSRESHDRLREDREKEQAKPRGKGQEDERGTLYERIVRSGMSAMTTNAIMGAVSEGVTAADIPTQQEVLERVPSLEGEVLPGPAEGGGFFDRPMAGAMADNSMSQSLDIEYAHEGAVSAAEGAGTMSVNGQSIEVAEYLPGADLAKIATGQSLDAGDATGILMERAMDNRGKSPSQSQDDNTSSEGGESSASGSDEGRTPGRAIGDDGSAIALGGRDISKDAHIQADPEARKEQQEVETKIERQALEVEHKEGLKEALRTQDLGEAVTERHTKHGELRMTTQFEARHPDNGHELKEGEEHVTQAIRSPRSESSTDMADIHFRTMMSEQENDKGISRF